MAFRCPTSFREAACERTLDGEGPEELADELEVSAAGVRRRIFIVQLPRTTLLC